MFVVVCNYCSKSMCMPSYNPFCVAMPYQNIIVALHLDWNTILPQKDKLF